MVEGTVQKWKCPLDGCFCSYAMKGDLKCHVKTKHPDSMHLLFATYPSLQRTRSSKKDKDWVCPIKVCPCGYSRLCDLKSHFVIHHLAELKNYPQLRPNGSFRCTECSLSFTRRKVCMDHMSKAHGKEENQTNTIKTSSSSHNFIADGESMIRTVPDSAPLDGRGYEDFSSENESSDIDPPSNKLDIKFLLNYWSRSPTFCKFLEISNPPHGIQWTEPPHTAWTKKTKVSAKKSIILHEECTLDASLLFIDILETFFVFSENTR